MRSCRSLFILLLSFVVTVTSVAAAPIDLSYDKARKAYFSLLESPRKQKYRDQWERVLQLFLAAREVDPSHQRAADALFMAGKVMEGMYEVSRVKADARTAVSYFDRLALEHPGSTLADDGLLHAATLLEEILKEPAEAYQHYHRVVNIYSDGDMHASAREGLRRLARYAPAVAVPTPPSPRPAEASLSVQPLLEGVRFHSYPDFTRVVLDLSASLRHTPQLLPGEANGGQLPRLLLDLSPARVAGVAPELPVDDGRIDRIRTGQNRDDTVRVVLEMRAGQTFQIFTLPDPYRVIIDISGEVVAKPQATPAPDAATRRDAIADLLGKPAAEPPLRLNLPPGEARSGPLRIVIDPGHGGKDPGAIGPRGVMEKEVSLALATRLARELKKRLECEVILTRDDDVYLPLDERTSIANRLDADLFISLHANANKSSRPYGIETYFLNFSKNQKVMELAAQENGTSLREVGDLEMILLDLMANAKLNESSRLAGKIQTSLVTSLSRSYSDIKDLGVRQGPFYVLFGATMPSVLVEVAFISNRREEQRLTDTSFQDRTARAIATGVQDYLNGYKVMANR